MAVSEVEERGKVALGRVLAARGGEIPYEAMAELIELACEHAAVRRDLLAELERQLWNPKRDMELAWLSLVAGEAGRDGLLALIELLGKTDSDDVAESAIPVLTRHAVEVYEDIKRAIDASSVADQRGSLYEALEGAAVLGDAKLKQDLTSYAQGRVERELALPARRREVLGPVRVLVGLGAPDARERLEQVRARTRDRKLLVNLDEQASCLQGGMEPLKHTRAVLKDGWRDTAENLRKLFHPTQEEERKIRELLASLGRGGRSVH